MIPRRLLFKLLALSLFAHINLRYSEAVNPACECIFFDGYGHLSNGSFTSPNYPVPYEAGLSCLLYTFVGNDDEIVELTFYHFELQTPDDDGTCSDFVKIFQDLEEPAVNEDSGWQEILCGRRAPAPLTFYSKGKAMIFEFHSDNFRSPNDVGFVGEFRFLNKREYLTSGTQYPHSSCNYHIKSTKEMQTGKIFSPYFPYYYPPNSHCHYWLSGNASEYIRITVHIIDMTPTYGSCWKSEDYLTIYDGRGKRLGDPKAPIFDPLLAHLCSKASHPETVISSTPNLYMEFHSGQHSKYKGRGFFATFEFLDYLPRTSLIGQSDVSSMLAQNASKRKVCEFNITSVKNGTSGFLQSPNYPNQYDANVRCEYHFVSRGAERVQITFDDFDLYHPDDETGNEAHPVQCRGEFDHLTAYVDLNNRMSEIKTFCGTETPPRLMSSRNQLTLEFIAQTGLNPLPRPYRGFQLKYNFVLDFGINTGERNQNQVCGFTYNSTVANNGSISSPNYPGYYPRNTDCHYTFHGKKDEKVRLFFTYFDIEGEPPCDNDSRSDYLEFSNYNTLDLKMSRYCGGAQPPKTGMESERDFFNVTFHSNAVFDRTGFFAYYQFINQETKAALKKVKTANAPNTNNLVPTPVSLPWLVLGALLLLLLLL